MSRLFALSAFVLALAIGMPAFAPPAVAAPAAQDATPKKKKPALKRHAKRWAVPPGVRTPEQIERNDYKAWRRERAFAQRYNVPRAYYFYYGAPFYTGHLGANRRDSLRAGPCWTQTPIGPVWNCGR